MSKNKWILGAAALATGLLHRLRGWGPTDNITDPPMWRKVAKLLTSKIIAVPLYIGLLYGLLTWDWVIGLITGVGYQVYVISGWGDYWDFSEKRNDEVAMIDWLFRDTEPGVWVDLASMSLRGMFAIFLFIGLAVYYSNPWPVAFGLLMLLQGPIYFLASLFGDDVKVEIAEPLVGTICIGGAIAMSLYFNGM